MIIRLILGIILSWCIIFGLPINILFYVGLFCIGWTVVDIIEIGYSWYRLYQKGK